MTEIRRSIRWKIILPLVAVVGSALTIYGWWELRELKRVYQEEALEKRATALVSALSVPLRDAVLNYDLLSLDRYLADFEQGQNRIDLVYAMISDREGKILAMYPSGDEQNLDFPASAKKQEDLHLNYRSTAQGEIFEVLKPLGFGENHWGYFAVGFAADQINRELAAARTRILIVAGLCIGAFVVFISLFMGRNLFRPIDKLVQGTEQVEQGMFDFRMPDDRDDEIGTLYRAYNKMATGLAQRDFLKEAFGKYVSPEIADAILSGEISLEGERREVSVLFIDIRSFTRFASEADPQHLFDVLTRFLEQMVQCVIEEKGMVNKFLGDGMMAIFGAPLALDNGAGAAVRAGERMIAAVDELNAAERGTVDDPIHIGIGIATGEAVVGVIETTFKKEYTAIGHTVNLASRIEGLTKSMGHDLIVDEVTAQSCSNAELVDLGEHEVRGVDAHVRLFARR